MVSGLTRSLARSEPGWLTFRCGVKIALIAGCGGTAMQIFFIRKISFGMPGRNLVKQLFEISDTSSVLSATREPAEKLPA